MPLAASAERSTSLNPQTRVGGINFSVVPSIGPSTASSPETRWGISGCRTDLASAPHNAFNQLTSSTSNGGGLPSLVTAYVYDNNGNLITETAGTSTTTYTWDADNRLRQLAQSGAAHSYEYDAKGLRTKKVEASSETRFLLDGQSVLTEFDSANLATRRYLHNPESIDDIYVFTEGGQSYFPLSDVLGSVVAITDSVGAVVRRSNYEVYGARSSTGNGPDWAFGFTGREQDSSAWRYHRSRYVSAVTGAWSQPDRAGLVDGPARYNYARARPTVSADPLGLFAWNATQIAHASVGAASSMAVAMVSFALFTAVGPPLDDAAGLEVFMAAWGAEVAITAGFAWELYFYNPGDNVEDLIADAFGAIAGAVIWLVITGVVAPRNWAWATILVGGPIVPGGLALADFCHRSRY